MFFFENERETLSALSEVDAKSCILLLTRKEMLRDVQRLSVLRDPSISKIIGTAANMADDTFGVMTEYLEGGHLPILLRQYRVGPVDNFEPGVKTIR